MTYNTKTKPNLLAVQIYSVVLDCSSIHQCIIILDYVISNQILY